MSGSVIRNRKYELVGANLEYLGLKLNIEFRDRGVKSSRLTRVKK